MRRVFFVVALLLITSLYFGAIVHTFAPHQHPENQGVVDLMHTAAAPGEKAQGILPLFVALFSFATAVLVVLPRREARRALLIRAASSLFLYARRGSARYRRFV